MNLEQHIEEIRSGIKSARFANEASVSQGIVLRLLHALGWPAYDMQVIIPEYALEGRRVDFALCHPAGKPVAFIEVKQLGQSEGAERQLFEYAFHRGIPLAILTDGQEWNFFLPAEQGDYGERRVYKLDIVERDVSECALRLNRYLRYEAVASGVAMEAARADYRNVSRDRQIKTALPQAWMRLVKEEDELLLELIADRVESLCGFKPDPDLVADFLKSHALTQLTTVTTPDALKMPSRPRDVVPAPSPQGHGHISPASTGFVLNGKFHATRNARDTLIGIFEAFAQIDPSFLDRFASLPKHGRTRRYLAKNPSELYPGRPDLVHDHSKQLSSGWWLSTNHSRRSIAQIIEMASNVMGPAYKAGVRIELGE